MSKRRAPKVGLWLAAIGSAVAIGSAFLPWYNVPHGVTVGTRVLRGTPPGWETRYGMIALAAAGVALLLTLIAASGKARVLFGGLVVAAAGVAIVAALFAMRDPRAGYVDWAAKKGATAKASSKDIRLSLESLFKISKLGEKAGVGTYGAIGGGGLAVLSGLGIVVGRRRARSSVVASEDESERTEIPAAASPQPTIETADPSAEIESEPSNGTVKNVEGAGTPKPKPRRPKQATASGPSTKATTSNASSRRLGASKASS
jgi:hypothetical protein